MPHAPVISLVATLLLIGLLAPLPALSRPDPHQSAPSAPDPAAHAFRIGQLDARILESSGIVASRRHRGVFWTHNDSNHPPELFAVTREGALLGAWRVDARNIDWEDIALGHDGRLYIGDIGDNRRQREEIYVHAVAEPDAGRPAPRDRDAVTPVEQTWTLRYPGGQRFDAEALVIHEGTGYIITKLLSFERPTLYAFDLDPARPQQTLRPIGQLRLRLPVTAADVSEDGRWLAVLTVTGPHLLEIAGDMSAAPRIRGESVRFVHPKMEACAFMPEGLLATTEARDVLLFRWEDFGIEP